MTRSLLRKRRPIPSTSKRTSLRPSLSLPDLTTPLLDPASWDDLPFFTPTFSPDTGVGSKHRQPSLVANGDSFGSPVRFHSPFTPWQVVNTFSPDGRERDGSGGFGSDDGVHRGDGDLRGGRGGMVGMPMMRRRKTKCRDGERLNVVVAGGRGVGKTR